ncbi:MAG: LamG-like jellyroll fold domain-containing protein [Saprospiraceae bacterium]
MIRSTKPLLGTLLNNTHTLNSGLLACYMLQEGAGIRINDSSFNQNNGTLTNASVNSLTSGWSGGQRGSVLFFDGSNDYISLTGNKNLDNLNSSSFSFSFWVKSNESTPFTTAFIPFSRGYIGAGGIYGLAIELGSTYIQLLRNIGDAGYHYSQSTISYGSGWNHFVVIYDKAKLIHLHYKNGQSISLTIPGAAVSASNIGYNATYDSGFSIGAHRRNISDQYGKGYIDDLIIWNRVITPDEVMTLYYEPYSVFVKNKALDYGGLTFENPYQRRLFINM